MHQYLITGTSRGLGKALAEAILQQPDTLVTGISRQATIQHPRYRHHPLDLSDLQVLQNTLPSIFPDCSQASSITLINNAGMLGEIGYVGELPAEHFELVFDVNMVSPAVLMNAFLSSYADNPIPQTILNISSGAGQRPVDGWSAYCASKAALDMFSRVVQEEQKLRGRNLRVYSLSPGLVDTQMQEQIRGASNEAFSQVNSFAERYKNGQLVEADEAARRIWRWLGQQNGQREEVVVRITDY